MFNNLKNSILIFLTLFSFSIQYRTNIRQYDRYMTDIGQIYDRYRTNIGQIFIK